VGALEPTASDLTCHLATDIGSILVCGSEMQTKQHSSFDDFLSSTVGGIGAMLNMRCAVSIQSFSRLK
jgi:hypothetical protein